MKRLTALTAVAPDYCAEEFDETPPQECVDAAIAAKHDAQAAVRYLRSRASELRIDPGRIAIGGFSAGAIASLLVGTGPEDVGSSGNPGFPSNVQGVVSNCGALPNDEAISAGDAPTVFFHGNADPLVPVAWAQSNFEAFWAVDVPANLIRFPGEGHCPNWERTRQTTVDQSKYFLYYLMDLPPE